MNDRLLKNINDLFRPYDLFSNTGLERNRDKMKTVIPDITESEIVELENYLKEFYEYCSEYGNKLSVKYKLPFLPHSDEAEKDIKEYISLCQEKYPEIDSEHIQELFSTICWLSNR
ncbi:MAG: hypothetical protein K2G63_07540 [Oscillospiraceae bacterium]|nr:hypothetical protein [Oscillospiraceae bacterium]